MMMVMMMIMIIKKQQKNHLKAKISSQIRQKFQPTSKSSETFAIFAETLHCAFSYPKWCFLLLFGLSLSSYNFLVRVLSSISGKENGSWEKLLSMLCSHISTGVFPGKLNTRVSVLERKGKTDLGFWASGEFIANNGLTAS